MKIALVPNLDKKNAEQQTRLAARLLHGYGAALYMEEAYRSVFCNMPATFCSAQQLYAAVDAVIAVGGDGTIIHCAKFAAEHRKPVLGINVGKLGYVAGLETDELARLKNLVDGTYTTEKRMMLSAVVSGSPVRRYRALNDVVISSPLRKIVDFSVSLQEKAICRYRADGIIFSTPTGSTAYALSAGGPVVDPSLRSILLTPICPHSLFARSVVFGAQNRLRVQVADCPEEGVFLTADGEEPVMLHPGDSVEIGEDTLQVELIRLKETNFYDVVNQKLVGNQTI